jgi:hypothetical protein
MNAGSAKNQCRQEAQSILKQLHRDQFFCKFDARLQPSCEFLDAKTP